MGSRHIEVSADEDRFAQMNSGGFWGADFGFEFFEAACRAYTGAILQDNLVVSAPGPFYGLDRLDACDHGTIEAKKLGAG